MPTLSKIATVTLLAVSAFSAQAQSRANTNTQGYYGELAIAPVQNSLNQTDGSFKLKSDFSNNSLRGLMGYQFTPMFSVEGLVGAGFGDQSKNLTVGNVAVKATLKTKSVMGLYLRAKTDLTPDLEVFGRVGIARADTSVTLAAGNISEKSNGTDNSLSFGVGANFSLSKTMYFGVDYTRYVTVDKNKIEGLGISVGTRF